MFMIITFFPESTRNLVLWQTAVTALYLYTDHLFSKKRGGGAGSLVLEVNDQGNFPDLKAQEGTCAMHLLHMFGRRHQQPPQAFSWPSSQPSSLGSCWEALEHLCLHCILLWDSPAELQTLWPGAPQSSLKNKVRCGWGNQNKNQKLINERAAHEPASPKHKAGSNL